MKFSIHIFLEELVFKLKEQNFSLSKEIHYLYISFTRKIKKVERLDNEFGFYHSKGAERSIMRLENNFINIKEHENIALEADLICDCTNDIFEILHTGNLKKGLFGGATLNKKEHQIIIKAKCSKCSKIYILYDSTTDGNNPNGNPSSDFQNLILKNDSHLFHINLKYNYLKEYFKTNQFEMILIDIKEKDSNKAIRIFET